MVHQPRPRSGRAGRLIPLVGALLLAALMAIPQGNPILAQVPPEEGVFLVNGDEDPVERKKDGRFIARPVFNMEIDALYYALRHPDTGDWLTQLYRVHGGERKLRDGWEYTFEYPALEEQPDLDPETAYLLEILVQEKDPADAYAHTFHVLVPVHQPGGLWDRVLGALDPGRWGRSFARWAIEGVHGTLCGVVGQAAGEDPVNCGEG